MIFKVASNPVSKLTENTVQYVYDIIWLEISAFLRHQLVPRFWSYFEKEKADELREKYLKLYNEEEMTRECENEICYQEFLQFAEAVRGLDAYYQIILQSLQKVSNITSVASDTKQPLEVDNRLKEKLRIALLAQFPANFQNMINSFYYISLRTFFSIQTENELGKIYFAII